MPVPVSSARACLEYIDSQSNPFDYLCSIADPAAQHAPYFEQEWLDFKRAPHDDEDAQ
jgi:hypothetical protein